MSSNDLIWNREDFKQRLIETAEETCFAYTKKSPSKSGANEDSLGILSTNGRQSILAIADGVGGHRGAAEASLMAISQIQTELQKNSTKPKNLRENILDAFEVANRKVIDMGVGAGTTLAVAHIKGNFLRPFHAGDSCILLVGQRSRVKYRNTPHSPIGYAVESGILENSEALDHQEAHIVSNVLGSNDLAIDLGPELEMGPSDTLLISSDGLTDTLEIDQIIEIIRKGKIDDAGHELAALALEKMENTPLKCDDLSFILYRRIA